MFYLSWSVNNYKKGNKNEKILMIIPAMMISLTSLPLYVFANDVSETAESQIAEQMRQLLQIRQTNLLPMRRHHRQAVSGCRRATAAGGINTPTAVTLNTTGST